MILALGFIVFMITFTVGINVMAAIGNVNKQICLPHRWIALNGIMVCSVCKKRPDKL
jgi:hypothetical protein